MEKASLLLTRLRRLLRRRGRSADESDDLIQEAFLRLQSYCHEQHIAQPEAFLVRTVLNLIIDVKRKHGAAPLLQGGVETMTLVDPGPLPEEVLIGQERVRWLNTGLEALSPRVREVFLLHRLEGYSYKQIAAELDLSVSTVEKHIAKASLFLFEWMAKERQS
jgi:RNA polymerase sigma factor (sigma-70 family)